MEGKKEGRKSGRKEKQKIEKKKRKNSLKWYFVQSWKPHGLSPP